MWFLCQICDSLLFAVILHITDKEKLLSSIYTDLNEKFVFAFDLRAVSYGKRQLTCEFIKIQVQTYLDGTFEILEQKLYTVGNDLWYV